MVLSSEQRLTLETSQKARLSLQLGSSSQQPAWEGQPPAVTHLMTSGYDGEKIQGLGLRPHKGKWKSEERMEKSSDLWGDVWLAEVFGMLHLEAFLVASACPACALGFSGLS